MIAVVPRYPEKDSRIGGPPMLYGQRLAWDLLREAGGDRFALFDLENAEGTPVYVHAKVCVVDDQWMTIGSDNLNRRSWTHDSEVTCAVVDPGGVLPRSIRTSLWAEHLGLPQDEPRMSDLSGALALWAEREDAPGSRIRRHVPPARVGLHATVGHARPTWPSTTPTADHEGCAARRTSDGGARPGDSDGRRRRGLQAGLGGTRVGHGLLPVGSTQRRAVQTIDRARRSPRRRHLPPCR